MPHFTMDEQKACGRQCLAIHSRCTSACGDMFSDADTEKRLQKCRHNYNSVLGDCYGTCK